jgi:hypothetical protein
VARAIVPERESMADTLSRAMRFAAILALALTAFATATFWRFGFGARISADAAVPLLLARHVLETGSLLPPDWVYLNGDLWIAGPQLLALPFVAAFGATPLALACANLVGLVAIFASAFALARAAGVNASTSVLAATPVVALSSHFQREFVVEQLSYGWMSAKLMLIVALALVLLRDDAALRVSRTRLAGFAYVALLGLWTAENPVRALIYVVLPLAAALALAWKALDTRRIVVVSLQTFAAVTVGALVHRVLLGDVTMSTGLESFKAAPLAEWRAHVATLVDGLRHLIGIDALGDPPLLLAQPMLSVVRAGAFALLIVLAVRRATDRATETGRIPLRIGVIGFVAVAAVLIVGSALVSPYSDRYLMPSWHLALVGVVVASSGRARIVVIALVGAFVLGGVLNAIGIARSPSKDAVDLPHPPNVDALVASLVRDGPSVGFATHRFANVINLRSGSRIEPCDIAFAPHFRAAPYLAPRRCIDPARYAQGFFVVLAPEESDDATKLRAAVGEPASIETAGGYAIWRYRAGEAKLDWLSR